MGEQRNPGDSTSFLVPQVQTPVAGWPIGSIRSEERRVGKEC